MSEPSTPLVPGGPAETRLTGWRRYGLIYATLWRNSVVREMGFKGNFVMWIVVELLWFSLQLAFMAVIYRHTESVAGWSKWQVVLLLGASQFVQQLCTALFLSNITQLSELIRTGKLDFILLLPVNTRFLVSLRQVDLGGFVNAAAGIAVMVYAARQLHLQPSVGHVLGFAGLMGAGLLIHYSLMLALASVSFWTVRAQGIVWGYYNLFQLSRLPDAAFHGFFKVFFTWVLPVLLVANVPTKLLVDKLASPIEMGVLLLMAIGCFVASEVVWRFSVRRYTSASS